MDSRRAATELLLEADARRRSATAELNQKMRSDLGQFMTPADVAGLMASMFGPITGDVRLLDAGAGVGVLTAAFVARACSQRQHPATISVTAFEIDETLLPNLRDTLNSCQQSCDAAGIQFGARIKQNDFLEVGSDALGGSVFADTGLQFDAAILNPPYRKISTDSRERRLVQRAGLDATNLYAAFVAISVRLLVPGGQLVAIMPRSFCNGPYFRAFREVLIDETSLHRIHVFESRKDAFKDDRVLQENVIVHATRSLKKTPYTLVSSSRRGSEQQRKRRLKYDEVIRAANGDRFIYLPTEDKDKAIADWQIQLPETLVSLGLTVSTGRVVDFRARAYLIKEPKLGSAPLIYPCHFVDGQIRWPKRESKKPNAILINGVTKSLLVPRDYYVVTKRFSSKEEKRRLVAAVYDPEIVKASLVGFENHLNYFHRNGLGLSRNEAYGLAVFLNSESVDRYFRQFNGHTQVNANDLRSLRYPSSKALEALGKLRLSADSSGLEKGFLERCLVP